MVVKIGTRSQTRRARMYRAWLDGLEVTHSCVYADVRRGVVRLLARDESGRYLLNDDRDGLVINERRGTVVLRPKLA